MPFASKEIKISLANLGDFHINNYRIGDKLGQTLDFLTSNVDQPSLQSLINIKKWSLNK
jgi:hypothetical protein